MGFKESRSTLSSRELYRFTDAQCRLGSTDHQARWAAPSHEKGDSTAEGDERAHGGSSPKAPRGRAQTSRSGEIIGRDCASREDWRRPEAGWLWTPREGGVPNGHGFEPTARLAQGDGLAAPGDRSGCLSRP